MHVDRDRGLHMFNTATANRKWSGKSEGLAYTDLYENYGERSQGRSQDLLKGGLSIYRKGVCAKGAKNFRLTSPTKYVTWPWLIDSYLY